MASRTARTTASRHQICRIKRILSAGNPSACSVLADPRAELGLPLAEAYSRTGCCAAHQLPQRLPADLAQQVPQRHFQRPHAAIEEL